MNHFKYKPLQQPDLILLQQWFQEPTIKHWYTRDKMWSLDAIKQKYEPRIGGIESIPSFIVYKDDQPFGFIQYYALTDFLPEGIADYTNTIFKAYQSENCAGIDLFIASNTDRGKGLGAQLVNQFSIEFLQAFQTIIVDPDIDNMQAIRCYEKAGFRKTTYSQNAQYVIMLKSLMV